MEHDRSAAAAGAPSGVGWGTVAGSNARFVGYIDGRQRIEALNASTSANGVFVGLTGHLESKGFDVKATVAHNWSGARALVLCQGMLASAPPASSFKNECEERHQPAFDRPSE
jgi:hypothetical protein